MLLEDDVIENDNEGSSNQPESTELPERAGGESKDRQDIRESAMEEAGEEASRESIVESLASKEGELTIEDLRKLPGTEGMSDQEVALEWGRAVKAAEAGNVESAEGTESFKLPFPVYDAQGNKIEALEKISVKDLFEGKIQLGYNAMGKEQRKSLTDALRNASLGHWNEQKYNTTVEERNKAATEASEYKRQLDQQATERKTWDAALTALAMGDINPMKQIAAAFQRGLTSIPQAIPGYVPIEQINSERAEQERGQKYVNEVINPAGLEIAKRYGADPHEVMGAIKHFIEREPVQFLTEAKVESILKYDVPNLFEANGYTSSGVIGQKNDQPNEIEELRKTVAALQTSVAEKKNASTQTAREKSKKLPPSGGGATPGAGDSMPSFKSRSQMKAWMQNDADWAKA